LPELELKAYGGMDYSSTHLNILFSDPINVVVPERVEVEDGWEVKKGRNKKGRRSGLAYSTQSSYVSTEEAPEARDEEPATVVEAAEAPVPEEVKPPVPEEVKPPVPEEAAEEKNPGKEDEIVKEDPSKEERPEKDEAKAARKQRPRRRRGAPPTEATPATVRPVLIQDGLFNVSASHAASTKPAAEVSNQRQLEEALQSAYCDALIISSIGHG
jgi:hypothetical protein